MNTAPDNLPQPEFRSAIVQAQIVLLIIALGVQLFLLTVIVEQFLEGDIRGVASLALASIVTFLVAFGIWRAHR